MKCVRIVGQGVPVRMSDADARAIVAVDKDGEYCSKSFWRKWYQSPYYRERGMDGRSRIDSRGRIVAMESGS